tara:strand:+ start:1078 stop:1707 length:630 start_codon:yes stop_codon:yes gene_type:complete
MLNHTISLDDISYFITNPTNLYNYLKNDFETDSKLIKKIIETNLNQALINKLLELLRIHILKYGNFNIQLNPKMIKSKHNYYLQIAKEVATKSLLNHQHGCVIVYKNKIVSSGYNRISNNNNKNYGSLHAEIDAILNLVKMNKFQNKTIRNNCSLYVIRIKQGTKELKMSKPCKKCIHKIQKYNIGQTYYSTNDSFIDDLICQFIKSSI